MTRRTVTYPLPQILFACSLICSFDLWQSDLDLISTLLSLSTTHLPLRTLSTAHHQLSLYFTRFKTRLATAHALHLKRLIGLLEGLIKFAEQWRDGQGQKTGNANISVKGPESANKTEVMTVGELTDRIGRKFEGVNLLEVEKYLRDSKVGGYMKMCHCHYSRFVTHQ